MSATTKPEPFFLSKAMAIEAARKAWNENRLGCQDPGASTCRYRYEGGRVCAIGAGLPDGEAKRFEGNTVGTLITAGHIKSDDPQFLRDLQYAHDVSCGNARRLPDFCALIGVDPPSTPQA